MSDFQNKFIEASVEQGVGVIRLNRSNARNALNLAVLRELVAVLEQHENDPGVRVIVLTGGEGNFSSGADIDMLGTHTAASYSVSEIRSHYETIRAAKKPMVAAVSGFCLGGGCEIALSCDYVIASDSAVFAQPEIKLGIIPGAGGTQLWALRSGATEQVSAALEGKTVTAFDARRMRLINQVVPKAALMQAALSFAQTLAQRAPLALCAAKAATRARWRMSLDAALDHEVLLMSNLLASVDAHEGIAAFLDKRPAQFRGA
jgi:enoyl-CoA hydratase/carnithine racemase